MKFSIKNHQTSAVAGLFLAAVLTGCATPPTEPVVTPPVAAPPASPAATAVKPTVPPPTGPIVVMPTPDPAPPLAVSDSPAEKDFTEGQNLYDSGDYKGAQRRLLMASNALNDASPNKQTSMKLLAFTYCLTNQRLQCRKQFNTLLALNPKFELTKSEAGHPLWGPVFSQAKKERSEVKK
jgi:hypothetical protein